MAAERNQRYRDVDRYGRYAPEYDGNAARKLERREELPSRSPRRRRHAAKRLNLEVREPGKIAPFAVFGLFAACLMAILVLSQYANLVEINDRAYQLKTELSALETEGEKLLAQYERAYDLQAIEAAVLSSGEMVKRQSSQGVLLELSAPNKVEYLQEASFGSGLLNGIKEIFSTIGAYF